MPDISLDIHVDDTDRVVVFFAETIDGISFAPKQALDVARSLYQSAVEADPALAGKGLRAHIAGKGPQLIVQDCPCDSPECESFVIAMLRPSIELLNGTDELASVLYVPLRHAPEIVRRVREFAAKRGVHA